MIEVVFLLLIALIWIIFASVQDLRKKEVANWLNFSLIIFAFGFRFFYSLFSESVDFGFFYQGVIGLAIFFLIGNMAYYGRFFAGGDAKLMIALGPVLGFTSDLFTNLKIYGLFLFIFLFVGGLYGLIWSLALMAKNFKPVKREFYKDFRKNAKLFYLVMLAGVILIILGFFDLYFAFIGIFTFLLPFFYLYAKAVDNCCMVKNVGVKELTEGDWLFKDIKVGRKVIASSWRGLNKEEIRQLRKKYRKIKIRRGIPFVPVFLISFLILIYVYFYFSNFIFSFLF